MIQIVRLLVQLFRYFRHVVGKVTLGQYSVVTLLIVVATVPLAQPQSIKCYKPITQSDIAYLSSFVMLLLTCRFEVHCRLSLCAVH
jgi:hypothetical protein